MVEQIAFHLIVPVIVGFIIGVLEAFFVYEDENMTSGKDFLGDMWHGLLFAIIGVFIASNIPWIMAQSWFPSFLNSLLLMNEITGTSIVASIIIALFMMVKMVASHAIKGVRGGGFSEKLWHKLAIAIAIGFAPYYLDPLYALNFFIGIQQSIPFLPL